MDIKEAINNGYIDDVCKSCKYLVIPWIAWHDKFIDLLMQRMVLVLLTWNVRDMDFMVNVNQDYVIAA